MLKKTFVYTDYNGNKREEDHYFNLSKAECMEMELSTNGGMKSYLERIVKEQDQEKIVKIFKELILKSYGIKSDDGKHFRKSPEISADFASTEAYSDLFMELATDADAAAKFITAVLPSNMDEAAELPSA